MNEHKNLRGVSRRRKRNTVLPFSGTRSRPVSFILSSRAINRRQSRRYRAESASPPFLVCPRDYYFPLRFDDEIHAKRSIVLLDATRIVPVPCYSDASSTTVASGSRGNFACSFISVEASGRRNLSATWKPLAAETLPGSVFVRNRWTVRVEMVERCLSFRSSARINLLLLFGRHFSSRIGSSSYLILSLGLSFFGAIVSLFVQCNRSEEYAVCEINKGVEYCIRYSC